jgi:DNA-directed RNA polymerase sigma subunit (sigma70/sigma32)
MKAANETKTVNDRNLNISMTFEEIAEEMGLTVKEVKDAYDSAIKKLRHPKVGKPFKDYINITKTEY